VTAKEAKCEVTVKRKGEFLSFWISSLSSTLSEAASLAGSSAIDVSILAYYTMQKASRNLQENG